MLIIVASNPDTVSLLHQLSSLAWVADGGRQYVLVRTDRRLVTTAGNVIRATSVVDSFTAFPYLWPSSFSSSTTSSSSTPLPNNGSILNAVLLLTAQPVPLLATSPPAGNSSLVTRLR